MLNDLPIRALPASARYPLAIAVGLVLTESVALLAFAVADLAAVRSGRVVLVMATSLFFLAYAGGQAAASMGLLRVASWARGPIVFTQLIQIGIAWGLRDGASRWLAGVLALVAIAVIVCLVLPRTTQALLAARDGTGQNGTGRDGPRQPSK